jgi:hypothetical protein
MNNWDDAVLNPLVGLGVLGLCLIIAIGMIAIICCCSDVISERVKRIKSKWRQKKGEPGMTGPDPCFYWDEPSRVLYPEEKNEDFEGPGWYYYDETWAHAQGPFGTEFECRKQLKEYCNAILGQ